MWQVEQAPLRFDVIVYSDPSEPSAGVIATLPDGGLLPRPVPVPSVYTPDGQSLECKVLWHNPAVGLALVFQPPPGGRRFCIYVQGAPVAPPPGAASIFRPSLLLFTQELPGASLEAALRLPGTVRASAATMGVVPLIGQRQNLFGADEHYVSYYSGWFKADSPGRIYLCTVSDAGSKIRVDGKDVAEWTGLHSREEGAKGQCGSWVDLAAGPHAIEYFHFANKGNPEAQALWKFRPETAKGLPVTIPQSAFLHSGEVRIAKAAFRDGRPVAAVSGNTQASSFFWFGEVPVNLYRLDADLAESNTPDTSYTWGIDSERQRTAATLTWLYEGHASRTITLTASNRVGSTRVAVPVVSRNPPRAANVNQAPDRQAYRIALLEMCRAVAPDKDPCARWSADLWALLRNVNEPFHGNELLQDLFTRGRSEMRGLPVEDRERMEDAFAGALRIADPDGAAKWMAQFEQDEKNADRKQHWQLERFDFLLYDRGDVAAARRLAVELQTTATGDNLCLAQIRLGDVERAAGNAEAAFRLYNAAQDQYRERAHTAATMHGLRDFTAPAAHDSKAIPKGKPAPVTPPRAFARPSGESWKTSAVQESSYYATVLNLIQGGYLFEARDALQRWELNNPLCKLSGDYPLAEAQYFVAAQHDARVVAGIEIYRKGVDISTWLPEAMDIELEALSRLGRKQAAVELARDILKRFPNLPVADKAKRVVTNGI